MQSRTSVILALAVTLLAGSAWAHHNMSALFDFNDRVTLAGTLTKMDWRNPHIYVFVDGKTGAAQAQVQTWSIEGPSPGFFRPQNINRATSRPPSARPSRPKPAAPETAPTCGLLRVHDAAGRKGRLGVSAELLSLPRRICLQRRFA